MQFEKRIRNEMLLSLRQGGIPSSDILLGVV